MTKEEAYVLFAEECLGKRPYQRAYVDAEEREVNEVLGIRGGMYDGYACDVLAEGILFLARKP